MLKAKLFSFGLFVMVLLGSQAFAQSSLGDFSGSWGLVAEGDGSNIYPVESPKRATVLNLVAIENNKITYINNVTGTILDSEGRISCTTVSTDSIIEKTGRGFSATNNQPTYSGVCPDRLRQYTFSASNIEFKKESESRIQMIFTRDGAKQKTWIYYLTKGKELGKSDSKKVAQALISAGFTGTNSISTGQIVCGYDSPMMMSSPENWPKTVKCTSGPDEKAVLPNSLAIFEAISKHTSILALGGTKLWVSIEGAYCSSSPGGNDYDCILSLGPKP